MLLVNTDMGLPAGWQLEETLSYGGRASYEVPGGSIDLIYHEILPGIMLTHINLACPVLPAANPMGASLTTINWCALGRCEVDFGEKGSMVVGEGTLCVSSALARSFSYPTGSYQGFEYFIDFDQLDGPSWGLLNSFGLTEDLLRQALRPHRLGACISPEGEVSEAIHAVERELAEAEQRHPWLLLQSLRLIMLLAHADLGTAQVAGAYLPRSHRDMAQLVYQQLVEHDVPAANLAPLAGRLGVSEASLRSYFSRVYGESPAAFARSRCLAKAARLLSETERSVSDIGQLCGYANPSKFSAAFRRAYAMNPLEYRRRSRLSRTDVDTAKGAHQ